LRNRQSFFSLIIAALVLFNGSAFAEEPNLKPAISIGQELVNALKIDKPLTFCNEIVPLNDIEIKERLERELLYAMEHQGEIISWLKRANRFFPHIEKVLGKKSLPDDLKYITIAESALRPLATSNKGAVGYWQFIEPTGARYGMEIDAYIDERRNFYSSTDAALAYLKDLYVLFGSWTLATAAYNMGEKGLKAEMLMQRVNNYYQLYLSQETQRYVFRILAAKIIMSNPKKFGYNLTREDLYQPLEFDEVEISSNHPVPIHVVALAANTYFKVIKDINPHIKGYYIPAGRRKILVPHGAAKRFTERYNEILDQWKTEKKKSHM
jgi:membrane-bound lytic murein transglycosylase D